jgi:hypothetical protein
LGGPVRIDEVTGGGFSAVNPEGSFGRIERDHAVAVGRSLDTKRIEAAREGTTSMQGTSRTIERCTHPLGKKPQDGAAPDGVASHDFTTAEAGCARHPQNIIGRKRNDFVMTATPALIAVI